MGGRGMVGKQQGGRRCRWANRVRRAGSDSGRRPARSNPPGLACRQPRVPHAQRAHASVHAHAPVAVRRTTSGQSRACPSTTTSADSSSSGVWAGCARCVHVGMCLKGAAGVEGQPVFKSCRMARVARAKGMLRTPCVAHCVCGPQQCMSHGMAHAACHAGCTRTWSTCGTRWTMTLLLLGPWTAGSSTRCAGVHGQSFHVLASKHRPLGGGPLAPPAAPRLPPPPELALIDGGHDLRHVGAAWGVPPPKRCVLRTHACPTLNGCAPK